MRQFEAILVYAELFAVLWPVVFGVRPRRGIVAGVVTLAFVAQLQTEGYRWQMLPLYLGAVVLAVGDIAFLDRDFKWNRRVSRGILGTIGVLVGAGLALALPVAELPAPSGQEVIGTTTLELVDRDRDEIYGTNPGGPRHLKVQVWYPAVGDSSVAPEGIHPRWDVVGPELAKSIGFPGWFLGHLSYSRSHTFKDLPVRPGSFPVIIYSHGWRGYRSIALNQIETLVSSGYVVIAPDHTYGAVATVLGDEEIVVSDPAALPAEATVSEAAYDTAAAQLVEVYSDDLISVLNFLDAGADGPFGALVDSLDLTRVGLFGHSTGGGAAVRTCLTDEHERCDAVLGMDAWVEPLDDRVLAESLTRPAMFMRSAEWADKENDPILRGIAERSESVAYWIGIDGTGHNDFVMTPLLSPVADEIGLRGPIPPGRIVAVINQFLLGFFDVNLLGTGSAAIENFTFDEVSLEVIGSVADSEDE